MKIIRDTELKIQKFKNKNHPNVYKIFYNKITTQTWNRYPRLIKSSKTTYDLLLKIPKNLTRIFLENINNYVAQFLSKELFVKYITVFYGKYFCLI